MRKMMFAGLALILALPVLAVLPPQYAGTPTSKDYPDADLLVLSETRAYTLTDLTNNQPYTVILTAMDGSAPILSQQVVLTPADHSLYLPRIMQMSFQ